MRSVINLLAVSLVLASCNHVYYSPNTANAPLLSHKGETKIAGALTSGGESDFSGGEVQAATAVSNHAAVMLNTLFVSKTYDGPPAEKGKGSYVEAAGGAFTAFDPARKWIGSIYVGAGVGTARNDYGNNLASDVRFSKFFLQPEMGFKSRYFEFVFVPKLSFVNWKVKQENLSSAPTRDEYGERELNFIRTNPSFFSFEPSVIWRIGIPRAKFQLAASSAGVKNSDMKGLVETSVLSTGLIITFNPLPKK